MRNCKNANAISTLPTRIRRYRLLSLIGSTRNSDVYVVLVPSTNQKMIMKIIPHEKKSGHDISAENGYNINNNRFSSQMENIERECMIHKRVMEHPYVMPIVDSFDFQNFRIILMPRAYGTLCDFRKKIMSGKSIAGNELTNEEISVIFAKLMYRCLKVVQYLHDTCSILHGDIKPTNIVLDFTSSTPDSNSPTNSPPNSPHPRLTQTPFFPNNDIETNNNNNNNSYLNLEPNPFFIDFGHARELKEKDNYICHCHNMTCEFSAPEVLALEPHSFPSDMFSLGLTFYYLVTGKELLKLKSPRVSISTMAEEMGNVCYTLKSTNAFREKEWHCFPESLPELIISMLSKSQERRPTALECLQHPFFEEFLGCSWIRYENEMVPLLSK
ncbi:hypothetical protein M9Y10_045746 [Tritrichomonas musculus]|uniref:Protein kinase domain-containing protein n=1 Tax=Tritrichomonas musculus TaxID=1915356 RepID=A0ABR2JX81_9EUKA